MDNELERFRRELRGAWRSHIASAKVWRARAVRATTQRAGLFRMLADAKLDVAFRALCSFVALRDDLPAVEPGSREDYRQTWRFAINAVKALEPQHRRGDIWLDVAAQAFAAYRAEVLQ